jgi:photosystem II stability/assembly factor-like uncharacterized protein
VSWSPVTITPDATLRGVASNGSRLVAVGNKTIPSVVPCIYVSDNGGSSWQERTPDLNFGASQRFNSVAWTGSHWITVGHDGLMNISPDGEVWDHAFTSVVYNGEWRSVARMAAASVMAVGFGGEIQTAFTSGNGWRRVSKLAINSSNADVLTSTANLTAVAPLSAFNRGIVVGQNVSGGGGSHFYTQHW